MKFTIIKFFKNWEKTDNITNIVDKDLKSY